MQLAQIVNHYGYPTDDSVVTKELQKKIREGAIGDYASKEVQNIRCIQDVSEFTIYLLSDH